MNTLKVMSLEKEGILCEEFKELTVNNEICFSDNTNTAVIYAPNGTGKSTIADIFNRANNTEYKVVYNEQEYSTQSEENIFHVIADQNHRNIIKGETGEFLVGDNIQKEIVLQREIEQTGEEIISECRKLLKEKFGINKIGSKLVNLIEDEDIKKYVKALANAKTKYELFDLESFVNNMAQESIQLIEYEEEKMNFLISDYAKENPILEKVLQINEQVLLQSKKIGVIEESDTAINVLEKYHNKKDCIVCDTKDIDVKSLLNKKNANKEAALDSLDSEIKELMISLIKELPLNEPFNIKNIIIETVEEDNISKYRNMCKEISDYKMYYSNNLINDLCRISQKNDIKVKIEEYNRISSNPIEIQEEDFNYIKKSIEGCIENRMIDVKRNEDNKRIIISLGGTQVIETERQEMKLSSGEQNFISLAFEILKAKNSNKEIIVIDDPLSSFDSIFKNKIIFMIAKSLEGKNTIILTHNTDVLRLWKHQVNDTFNLYMLNNVHGQNNGFVSVNDSEKDLLISIHSLLDLVRNEDLVNDILDIKQYLIAMIPFMRGYAKLIGNNNVKNKLTKIMHGYNEEDVDVSSIYNELFNNNITDTIIISVQNILDTDLNNINIINNDKYPLLNKTLKHSLIYLYLRLLVENKLVNKYNIKNKKRDNLAKIIQGAYNGKADKADVKIMLMSKKTLLNEFNHFEGNMNIFQPAIDITEQALEKEKKEIIELFSDNNNY